VFSSHVRKYGDIFALHCTVLVGIIADYQEQPVMIRVTDVNDEIPDFKNVPRPFLTTVSVNAPPGTSVYQLMAQDADEGSVVRYILESGRWSVVQLVTNCAYP